MDKSLISIPRTLLSWSARDSGRGREGGETSYMRKVGMGGLLEKLRPFYLVVMVRSVGLSLSKIASVGCRQERGW